jgi:hypothetical protein
MQESAAGVRHTAVTQGRSLSSFQDFWTASAELKNHVASCDNLLILDAIEKKLEMSFIQSMTSGVTEVEHLVEKVDIFLDYHGVSKTLATELKILLMHDVAALMHRANDASRFTSVTVPNP